MTRKTEFELAKFQLCSCARFFLAVDGMQFGFALDVYVCIYVYIPRWSLCMGNYVICQTDPCHAPPPRTHFALAVAKKQSRQRKDQK